VDQRDIIEAVASGRAHYTWVSLPTTDLQVMADAVTIDGVRVAVSARTAQQVADILTADDPDGWRVMLPTPEVVDLVYRRAARHPPPQTLWQPGRNIAEWRWTVEHSRRIDEWLAAEGARAGEILEPVGKWWCVTDRVSEHVACNHGWQRSGGAPIQDRGHQHGIDHHDYSQVLRLIRVPPGADVPGLRGMVPSRQPGVPEPPPDTDPAPRDPRPLHVRALEAALGEAIAQGCNPDRDVSAGRSVAPERVADYFVGCERGGSTALGRWLRGEVLAGKRYSFCAAAIGWCEHAAARPDEHPPPWRAGALEIMRDAEQGRRGTWQPIESVRAGERYPESGDVAIHWRDSPTSGKGHAERVIDADRNGCRTVGANERGGRWVVEPLSYDCPTLLGFVTHDEPETAPQPESPADDPLWAEPFEAGLALMRSVLTRAWEMLP